MDTARVARPTITSIVPPEILSDIFSRLCSHCSDDVDSEDIAANTKALLALTQTCRHFRSIAMPILFHNLGPHLPSNYIFRVLDDQPDLAHVVKHLFLPLSRTKTSSIMTDSVVLARLADRLSLSREWIGKTQFSVVDAEMCLAMALCSDIERLKIQIADHQIFGHPRHFEILYSLLENRKHEDIFPKLRHLDIDKTQGIQFSLCDPEPILLLRGASRLEKLIFRGPGDRTPRQNSDAGIQEFCAGMTNVTELRMEGLGPFFAGSWQTRALERILGAARKLEALKFVGVGDFHSSDVSVISPSQLIEFLNPQTKKTLQRLSLNLDRARPGRNCSEPWPIQHEQIKQFTSLKTLEVDPSCYCIHRLRDGFDIDQFLSLDLFSEPAAAWDNMLEQETYLVDFLPQTVQTLTIILDRRGRYELIKDSTLLAQRVVSGEFPNLKRVQVDAPVWRIMPWGDSRDDGWDKEQPVKLSDMKVRGEAFEEIFIGSGVETRFKTWVIWTDKPF